MLATIVGRVRSIMIVTDPVFDRLTRLVAEQVTAVPLVSAVSVTGSHPLVDATPDCESLTRHVTVTALTYQPLLPSVPLTIGVISGGVVSKNAPTGAPVTG